MGGTVEGVCFVGPVTLRRRGAALTSSYETRGGELDSDSACRWQAFYLLRQQVCLVPHGGGKARYVLMMTTFLTFLGGLDADPVFQWVPGHCGLD